MGKSQMKDYRNVVINGMREIAGAVRDELDRSPSIDELLDILTWGLRATSDNALQDVHPSSIKKLKLRLKRGGECKRKDALPNATLELNDNVFVVAGDFLSSLSNIVKIDTGEVPTLDLICELLVNGLQECAEGLLCDVNPECVAAITPQLSTSRTIKSKVGDIVAIPAQNGDFFVACILAKNRVGVAYGFFRGTTKIRPISISNHPIVDARPIYSGDSFIASGRWPIIGHDQALLALFPEDPEIYYPPKKGQTGVYGLAEAVASGQVRELTQQEAKALGLLDGTYRQTYLEEYLEQYLNQKFL